MIRYLRGTVIEKVRNQLVVDVHGVGYDLFVTPMTLTQAEMGQEQAFHISESVREDAHDLFGFSSTDERDMFELLRKVSGVGPKVALAICGFYPPPDFHSVIQSGDSPKLSLVPGIGKKMAEKIILELKDKAMPVALPSSTADIDTVEALQSLGYNAVEIAKVLPKVPLTLKDSSEKITWILRHLGE